MFLQHSLSLILGGMGGGKNPRSANTLMKCVFTAMLACQKVRGSECHTKGDCDSTRMGCVCTEGDKTH